jgi:hypothetical protein
MNKSVFQLFKNTGRTNTNARLHGTPIIDFGRVIKVIDIQTVIVETIIQTSLAKEIYTVTLLNLSSALLEISDEPKLGDTVLLLFLRKHHPLMFMRETIDYPDASGYNKFSGAGILMSAAKQAAHTVISCYTDDGKPVADIKSGAEIYGTFHNSAAFEFCRAVFDGGDERVIHLVFGAGRPLVEKHLARIERLHGFWKDPENELIELEASVTERYSVYAPITKDIQGSQTTDAGLGADKDDNPVETEAPITETVHGKAPIARDIRSPQTVTIGVGNTESGNENEERDAPITETVHGKSPITRDIRSPQTLTVGLGSAESGNENEEREAPVTETVHGKAPITRDIRSPQTLTVGIGNAESGDGKEEREAPVTETYGSKSPITRDIRGAQTTDAGLGRDADDKPLETDAPIAETVHGKAPITRDIRSPQTLTVGIGNAESGDAEEERNAPVKETYGSKSPITKDVRGAQTYKIGFGKAGGTDAPVDITLGGKADITVQSMSGKKESYQKDVEETAGGSRKETTGGDRKETTAGSAERTTAGGLEETVLGPASYKSSDTDIVSMAPIGLNLGIYKTALGPYLAAETSAHGALAAAVQQALPQIAALDALSGGAGTFSALGAALAAFTAAIPIADTACGTGLAAAVK